jgi:hypothetical protein
MVYLVGARRSGTNWLHRILAVHPDVRAIPSETHLFSHGVAVLADRLQHGSLESTSTGRVYMRRDEFVDAAREFCDRVFLGLIEGANAPVRYLVERTPWHVYHLDLIGELYPDAAVIHIVRDGRDVARSLLTQGWKESAPANMVEAAEEWRSAIVAARSASPNLARYREVRYEALLADPAAHAMELFEWLDLPTSADLAQRVRDEAGARFNVDAAMPTVGTGKWRKSLTPEELAAFDAVAGELLATLGYEPTPASRTRAASDVIDRLRPDAVRRRAGVAIRRVAGRSPSAPPPKAEPLPIEGVQRLFDDVVGYIHTGRYDELPEAFSDDVRIATVWEGVEHRARGQAGIEHLLALLRADDAHRGVQLRGEVHPGGAVCTGVYTHAGADGRRVDTVVVAHFGHKKIRMLSYYRFPLSGFS